VYFKLGDTAYFGFCTHNPATGAVADASSTPTCEIFEENSASAMAYVPTVAQRGSITGEYEVPVVVTAGNGFSAGKNYNVVISATVVGVTGKKVVGTFYVLSKKLSDLNDLAQSSILSDATPFAGANINATISSRSTLTAADVWGYATRTLSSFGTLIADIWAYTTRSLTDKAGFSLSGAKTTLDALQDLSQAQAQAAATAALNAYDPPTRGELTSDKNEIIAQVDANEAKIDLIDALMDAIKAKTDGLPADPASQAVILAAVGALNDISVSDLLTGNLADDQGFPANSLADLLRKLFWVLCNRLRITDATGAFTGYKSDGVTPAVTGAIVDDGTHTQRSTPTWP
jgi:hypothetical protein